jgi:putative endonuclease
MAEHNQTGKEGESIAQRYLKDKGYIIVKTNWHCSNYEVDIIATQNDTLVFLEVKIRTSSQYGEPELFVTKQKQRNIIKAASIYAERYQWQGEIRFDIVAILKQGAATQVNHIENAFGCSW